MALIQQLRTAAVNAWDALRGGSASRIPDGAIVWDPAQAIRWTCEYTPARLTQIKARCNLTEVVELCAAMLTDDRLRANAQTRALALIGSELEFVEGQGRRRKRALNAADAESDLWEMLPETEWQWMFIWGILANFGTGQKRWWEMAPNGRYVPRRRNKRIVPSLEFWEPRNFRLDTNKQWWARVETPTSSLGWEERPMAWDDHEFCAFCPWGGRPGEALNRGLWIAACVIWLLKQQVIVSGATLGTRMSMPIKVIEFALGQQGVDSIMVSGADKKHEDLANQIFAMQRNGVISLPPGFTMKLMGVPPTSWQMLSDQWNACNDALGILFHGNNLVSSIKGGSLAAAQSGQDIFNKVKRFDANAESTFIHNEVMVDWATINFNAPEAAPWPYRNVDPPEDKKTKSETLESIGRAGNHFAKLGWKLDPFATAEEYEFDLLAIEEPAPAAAPAEVPNAMG